MENENRTEVIKNRSYVACLNQGMSHPALHFRVIIKSLWPSLLSGVLLAVVTAFMPGFALRMFVLHLLSLVMAVVFALQLNVLIRRLVDLGYIPEMKPRALWALIPRNPMLFRPRWHYSLRMLGVGLMALFVASLVWFCLCLPLGAATLFEALNEIHVHVEMDPSALPAGFHWIRALAYALSILGLFLSMMLLVFPIAFCHGSILAEERERSASPVA